MDIMNSIAFSFKLDLVAQRRYIRYIVTMASNSPTGAFSAKLFAAAEELQNALPPVAPQQLQQQQQQPQQELQQQAQEADISTLGPHCPSSMTWEPPGWKLEI